MVELGIVAEDAVLIERDAALRLEIRCDARTRGDPVANAHETWRFFGQARKALRKRVREPFEKLKERTPEMADEVEAILAEHADLIAAGKRFLEAILAVTGEAFVLRDDLIARGYAYLSMLERHMDKEEGRLFPAARAALTAPDWVELEKRIEQRQDPLFGSSLDDDYRRLWRRIQAHRPRDVDERFR